MLEWLSNCFFGTKEKVMKDALTEMETNITNLETMETEHKEAIAKQELKLAATNDEVEQDRIEHQIALHREEIALIEANIPMLRNERHTLVRAKTLKPIDNVYKTSYKAKKRFYS